MSTKERMIDTLPPGLLKGEICSFLNPADVKNLHQTSKEIAKETENAIPMSASDKLIWEHKYKLDEMDWCLSDLREQFHQHRCIRRRTGTYYPRDAEAKIAYHKFIYNPYFSVYYHHGYQLYGALDSVAGLLDGMGTLEIYKKMDGGFTQKYVLNPDDDRHDKDVYREMVRDQIALCANMTDLCAEYRLDDRREILKLQKKLEKLLRERLKEDCPLCNNDPQGMYCGDDTYIDCVWCN